MENFARFDDLGDMGEQSSDNLGLEKFAVVMSANGLNSIVTEGSKFEIQDTYDILRNLNLGTDIKVRMLNVSQLNIDKYRDDSRQLSKLLESLITAE